MTNRHVAMKLAPCALAVCTFFSALPFNAPHAVADAAFELELQDTGKRDYYCTATFALRTHASEPLDDVNGYFLVFAGEEQVGKTKATSFRFEDGKKLASAIFEAPNAPCAEIDGYQFVVGACLRDRKFLDLAECAAAISPLAPVRAVNAR